MTFKANISLNVILVILVLLANLKIFFMATSHSDALLRLSLDDSVMNLFAFFWTNFWYIPITFWILFSVSNCDPNLKIRFTFFVFFYLYEFLDLSSTNWNSIDLNTLCLTNNIFLTNAINKFHPGLFYLSVAHFFVIVKLLYSWPSLRTWWTSQINYHTIKNEVLFIFVINLIALFLGSWWALQEGSWGGWWNWDASETFGFFLCVFCIKNLHLWNLNFVHKFLFFYIQMFFFFYASLYFVIQLNFDLISHNFGIKFFFFFNNSFFLLEGLALSLFCFLKLFIKFLFVLKNVRHLVVKNYSLFRRYRLLITAIFVVFFILIFCASFAPVLSYFLWTFFNVNSLNNYGLHNLAKINIATYLIFWLVLKPKITNLTLVLALFLNSNILNVLVCFLLSKTLYKASHSLIFYFSLFNSYAVVSQLSLNFIKTSYLFYSILLSGYWTYNICWVADENTLVTSYLNYPYNSLHFPHLSFLQPFTHLPVFNFIITSQIFIASLLTVSEVFTFSTQIEVYPLSFMVLLFFVTVITFFTYLRTTKKTFIF